MQLKKGMHNKLQFSKYKIAADYLTFPKGISISKQCSANTSHSTELLIKTILAQIKCARIIPIKVAQTSI